MVKQSRGVNNYINRLASTEVIWRSFRGRSYSSKNRCVELNWLPVYRPIMCDLRCAAEQRKSLARLYFGRKSVIPFTPQHGKKQTPQRKTLTCKNNSQKDICIKKCYVMLKQTCGCHVKSGIPVGPHVCVCVGCKRGFNAHVSAWCAVHQ